MKHLWIMSTIMLFYMNAAFSNTNNFLERFGRNPQLTAKAFDAPARLMALTSLRDKISETNLK